VKNAAHAASPHPLRPRQERVVHQRAHRPPLRRLGPEELAHGLRPGRLQPGRVRLDPAGLAVAAAVAAVGDGGDVDGASRGRLAALAEHEPGHGQSASVAAVRDGGDADGVSGARLAVAEHEPRRGERAPHAPVRREALTELEDRVDVALARVREQEDVDVAALRCVGHG